jgi:hypothetical protein
MEIAMRFAAAPLVLSLALLAAPAFAQDGTGGMNNGSNASNHNWSPNNGQYSANENGNYGNNYPNQATNNYGPMNRHNGQYAENQQNMANPQNMPGISYDTQRRIWQSLEQNGFRDVRVRPEAFVVQAIAPDGSRIVMEVSPDQFAEIVQPNAASGSSSSDSNQQMNQSNSWPNHHWNSGSSNWNSSDENPSSSGATKNSH